MTPSITRAEDLVVAVASFMRPKVYVEIGTYLGNTFLQVAAIPGVKAYGCDAEVERIDRKPPSARFFPCPSRKFFWELERLQMTGTVNLAFVDGSHEEEDVVADIANLLPLMAPDGLVFVHDAYPPTKEMTGPRPDDSGLAWSGDVYRAISRVAASAPGLGVEVTRLAPFNMALIRNGRKDAPWE